VGITLVSVGSDDGSVDRTSDHSYVSADGRYITFQSASALVADDTNGVEDVFVHDRITGKTVRASTDANGMQGNAPSDDPAISADGRHVTFRSQASNFVPFDTNWTSWDVFTKDLETEAITRDSVTAQGKQSNGASHDPVLSADGRYVAFQSFASNLVAGDTNGAPDIFLRDRTTGSITRISITSHGGQANGPSEDPAISDDGTLVAFDSTASNLVGSDTNAASDVFVRDATVGTTIRVSTASSGAEATAGSVKAALAGDGSAIAFASDAPNLVAGDTNAKTDIFVKVLATGATSRASVGDGGAEADKVSGQPSISRDGTRVTFNSQAQNLVPRDTNGAEDIFVRDLVAQATVRVSLGPAGLEADALSRNPAMSADGTTVAFESDATNLVGGDANDGRDVFVCTLVEAALGYR
jgi:Tol biopolymer transport system component